MAVPPFIPIDFRGNPIGRWDFLKKPSITYADMGSDNGIHAPINLRTGPPPVTRTVGGGGANGTNLPHIGGETWAGSSNQGGTQFNANPFQVGGSGHSHGGDGMTGGPPIHGYAGAGLNTRDFTNLTGRAPTAADVEMTQGGSLSPAMPQMNSLDSYQNWLRGPSQWQRLQGPSMLGQPQGHPLLSNVPLAGLDAKDIPQDTMMAADGGDIPAGQPVIVGERGPEMVVPNKDVTVIPHEYLPSRHLSKGDIKSYLMRFL